MYDVKTAAEKLGISQSLLYQLVAEGRIRHYRPGGKGRRGCIRIPPEAIPEYLKTVEVEPQEAER